MNIRDLQYLIALADHGHFGKAADACFVSQPALSMQIKKLEEELGIKLLERSHKSVLLTETGIVIVERARNILNQVDELRGIAKLAKDPYAGELKLGIFPTLAPYLLPLIIPELSTLYPKLSFYLIEEKTDALIEQLHQGKLDAVFLALPVSEKNFITEKLFEEEFLLAVPRSHALAKKKLIHSHDLDHHNLLLLEEGHCLRTQTLAFCKKIHASETQSFRATSLETLRQMVSAGVGITLIPKLACGKNDNIVYIPFSDPKPARSIALFWRNSTAKQALLKNMVSKIKAIMKKQKAVTIRG
jgi:LysR family hydrogen peroxide-inducible transcriptional activator